MHIDRYDSRSDQLVRSIYATLGGSSRWPDVLGELCEIFDGRGSLLVDHNFGNRRGSIRFKCDHFDDLDDRTYNTKMCSRNPWLHSDLPYRQQSAILGSEILSDTELTATEFYREYLHPLGLMHRLCGVIRRDGLDICFVAILRTPKQAPFDTEDKAKLRRLLPHLEQAFDLRKHFQQERGQRQALIEVLDHIPIACMLVNKGAGLQFVNNSADQLLGRREGLMVRAGCLSAGSSRQSARLRSAIARVAAGDRALNKGGESQVVERPSNRPPLLLSLLPIQQGRGASADGSETLVAILTKDPDGDILEPLEIFAEAYHLTKAEVRLIGLLAEGSGLFEAAEELGITRNTARTHMRHIYSKIGAHRQSDLIRLLAKLGSA